MLERMRYEGVVDIFQTVKMLRTQRPAMVQTEVRKNLVSPSKNLNPLWVQDIVAKNRSGKSNQLLT